jgi:hypothetical protein
MLFYLVLSLSICGFFPRALLCPSIKTIKTFTDKINHLATLPNAFNIKNSLDLLKNLENTPVLPQYTLASLDITNLYSNVPVKDTKKILANIMTQQLVDNSKKNELLKWYDVITQQNYFAHKDKIFIQHEGLAMGPHPRD